MTRALVLGGGGPVGVAWESGLIAGLAEEGVDLSNADFFVGTSAGSIVGSQLALGRAPQELYERQLAPAEPGRRPAGAVDMSGLIGRFIQLFTSSRPLQELRAEFGSFALQADTMSEAEWLAGFMALEGMDADAWPPRRFTCTAIDTADGEFVAWDKESRVPLSRAVASSCAVPGIYPPVTIHGRRYMDGGVGSTTNATLASSYGRVLVIVVAGASSGGGAIGEAVRQRFEAELRELRASGSTVDVVRPNDEFAKMLGVNLMDFTRRREAAEAGLRQGRVEADRLRSFWC